ncbi:MAG TPA: hypothetical protein VL961_00165 [Acidimicrobiales bacterium]|nr:hypothetical protein [Acidimicrobiales bacterium]
MLRTQRALAVALGLFWTLDAALQFQPFMFGRAFVEDNIIATANGQPAVVHWVITDVGHFLLPHIAVWNTFFALIQLAIGAALLSGRGVKVALGVSFLWALGVWVFGEGMGLLLTGSATALTGAPGSVLVYGLLGLMAWPREAPGGDTPRPAPTGVASSPAGQGLGGAITPLAVWSGYWVLAAVLFVLPENRTPTSVASAVIGMEPGSPGWFSHLLNDIGSAFGSKGVESAWILAVLALVIGLGPLCSRRIWPFLLVGGVTAFAMWVSGQGLLGDILTGSGTDPNTGPLVMLLALAMVPTVAAEPARWRAPFARLLDSNPGLTWLGVGAVGLAVFLAGAYPAPRAESSTTAMAGMADMGDTGTAGAAATNPCSAGNGGLYRTGLDISNSPYMIMAGHSLGMDMNGSDAAAAAGINSTKDNWSYTGPALPPAYAHELLREGGDGPTAVRMAATGCAHAPTASQEINAVQYVQATSQSVARYGDPLAALAAGYVSASPTDYPVTYYVNPAIEAANARAARTLAPGAVDGLVYARTPAGTEVLAAAMYVLPSSLHRVPMPYGPLVQWHERTDVCGTPDPSPAATAAAEFGFSGLTPCAPGTTPEATPYVTMVWQVPVAGGPLAIQPPDIQIVEAAVMSTSS